VALFAYLCIYYVYVIFIDMKKSLPYLIVAVLIIIGIIVAFSKKSNNTSSSIGLSECSQFSKKDGYTGCMSLVNGKEKKCKFKISNKINEATQKMEFEYLCIQK